MHSRPVKMVRKIVPFGWCLGVPAGGESHAKCPGEIVHSAGRYKGQSEKCVCDCHGEQEYSEGQLARMSEEDVVAPSKDDDDDDDDTDTDTDTEENNDE